MSKPQFVSLHNHTHNSMLDGYSKTEEYIEQAIKLRQPGLGVSDHGNTFGIFDFVTNAKKAGLTPTPGIEIYMAPINPEGARAKHPVFYGPNGKAPQYDVSGNGAYTHMTIWAYNQIGLKNLFKLTTMSYNPDYEYQKPRIDFDMLAENSDGLIVATGCPSSEISTRFLLDQDDKAYEYAGRLKEVFNDRLFVEIMNHDMKINLERKLLPKQLELSKKLGIPLLATNDAHYALPENAKHHEELLCTQSNSVMSDPTYAEGGRRFAFEGSEYYLKSTEQMIELFPERDFPGAIKNTVLINEMSQDIELKFNPDLKPQPIIPEGFKDEVAYYKHLINQGFKERYGDASPEVKAEAKKRNIEEFEVFHSSDFIGYMLVVQDYLNWTKKEFSTYNDEGDIIASPLGVGRGSVGGSIHAFELGISELDPIKHDLVFERFLSAGRGATYRITYDDGSTEEIVVSEKKKVLTENNEEKVKYIHQLELGDTVL